MSNNDLISREELKRVFFNNYDSGVGLDFMLDLIDNAPAVVTNCENCPFKKFAEDLTDKLAKVMVDNGITDFDEFAKQCGVSYLHQDSITTTKQ